MPDLELSLKKARSILKEGKKDHGEDHPPVYEGEIPDDEKQLINDAVELVELAEQAKENDHDHPAIDKILFLAEVDGGSASDPNASDEPWEGYDDEKLGKILVKLAELDDDELSAVFEYERDNENRDTLIAALEEIAEERGLTGEGGGDEASSGDEPPDEPWNGYDEDTKKDILKKLPEFENRGFLEDIKRYEEEHGDRAAIIAVLDSLIEEAEPEEPESDGSAEDGANGDDVLTRERLEEMGKDELEEVINLNELDYEIGDDTAKIARVKIADELNLEWAEENEEETPTEPEEGEQEEGVQDDVDWETLSQLGLDELKELISEKDLDMGRITKRTDLDKLRLRIAEELEVQIPAPVPWRGYDKRDMEQILKKLPKLDDEELGQVYEYETQNKNRKTIIKALDKIAEERGLTSGQEETEPEPEEEDAQGSEGGAGSDAQDEPEGEAGEESQEGRSDEEASGREDDEGEHFDLIAEITKRVEEENLVVPKRPPDNQVEMPFDLTELSDREVRQTYSAFTNYFARAAFVAKIEKQLAQACKLIADDKQNSVLTELAKIDPETEKEKTATQLKAEAESDDEVRTWRKRERGHRAIYESMRDDCSIYQQNIESLSREWTMRHEEVEHSGGLSRKPGKRSKD